MFFSSSFFCHTSMKDWKSLAIKLNINRNRKWNHLSRQVYWTDKERERVSEKKITKRWCSMGSVWHALFSTYHVRLIKDQLIKCLHSHYWVAWKLMTESISNGFHCHSVQCKIPVELNIQSLLLFSSDFSLCSRCGDMRREFVFFQTVVKLHCYESFPCICPIPAK